MVLNVEQVYPGHDTFSIFQSSLKEKAIYSNFIIVKFLQLFLGFPPASDTTVKV